MEMELIGKVALITGAGQGIGRGIAHILAQEGVRVAVNDFFEDRAKHVVKEIREDGGTAMAVVADITNLDIVGRMIHQIEETLGPVDILVNNAGVPVEVRAGKIQRTTFADSTPDYWRKQINLNLYGCMNCTHRVLKKMIEKKNGKIINIISEAGRIGQADLCLYGTAKAGVLGFTKSLAKEVGIHCINVNCISVGAVAHEGTKPLLDPDATPETDKTLYKFLKAYPIGKGLGRLGRTQDIANAVTFLASPKSCYITGQCLSVSGGFTMIG